MCIYMAGVDVHSADVSERERFAFSEEQVRHILQELVQKDGISGAVLLATCNRTELYLSVQSDRERTENNAAERQPAEQISPAQLLQYYAGSSAEPPHILVRTELDAAQHLMEVACGLHSQILHEEQIVTQVGRAVELENAIPQTVCWTRCSGRQFLPERTHRTRCRSHRCRSLSLMGQCSSWNSASENWMEKAAL